MGLFERLSVVVRANLNEMIENAENPEMVLDQTIENIEEILVQTKVAIAKVENVPNQRAKINYDVAMAEVNKWQENLRKAKQANNERLAFYALERLKNHKASARIAESQLDKDTGQAVELKQNLDILKKRLAEAKAMKYWLKLGAVSPHSLPPANQDFCFLSLEKRLQNIEHELETVKDQLLKQQHITNKLLSSNSTALKEVRLLLKGLNSDDIDKSPIPIKE